MDKGEGDCTVDLSQTEHNYQNDADNNYDRETPVDFYIKELREKFTEVYKCVQTTTDSKVEKSKVYHNRNIKPNEYKEGLSDAESEPEQEIPIRTKQSRRRRT
ncbi:hypothetical protein BpHYR1_048530 [Brachionus plicatilis]|uniref:Uncharacterized protein n=1 Tax=Brachionus plicatilis TaxID=10195 RepID=A0A3M7Q702_BRAPC|nr:hypothetical protein BpHYR1_048530 [Brachionus plicatilis]